MKNKIPFFFRDLLFGLVFGAIYAYSFKFLIEQFGLTLADYHLNLWLGASAGGLVYFLRSYLIRKRIFQK
jgi:hypothetical protein